MNPLNELNKLRTIFNNFKNLGASDLTYQISRNERDIGKFC